MLSLLKSIENRVVTEAASASVKMAARDHNVVGPNGNEAIAYEWRWIEGVKFSKQEDGLVNTKESDWDNAEKCASCGRKIVHIFWVKDVDDGEIRPYGGDHLHVALGYPREVSQAKLSSIRKQVTDLDHIRKERAYFKDKNRQIIDKRAAKKPGDANRLYMATRGQGTNQRPLVWIVNDKRGILMRGDDLAIDRFLGLEKDWRVELDIRSWLDRKRQK